MLPILKRELKENNDLKISWMETPKKKYHSKIHGASLFPDLVLVHYGSSEYKSELFREVKNENWVKPRGGLWTSPLKSNWGWKDWCLAENFRTCDESDSFNLKFKDEAKILVIDSLQDLEMIPKSKVAYSKRFSKEYPDFELLAKECDAIWLTESGQRETHLSHPLSLYGWDCESVLILNPNCCYEVTSTLI